MYSTVLYCCHACVTRTTLGDSWTSNRSAKKSNTKLPSPWQVNFLGEGGGGEGEKKRKRNPVVLCTVRIGTWTVRTLCTTLSHYLYLSYTVHTVRTYRALIPRGREHRGPCVRQTLFLLLFSWRSQKVCTEKFQVCTTHTMFMKLLIMFNYVLNCDELWWFKHSLWWHVNS